MQVSTTQRPKDLIDVARAARRLRVHISTIFRWIQTGRLSAWKRRSIGGKKARFFVSKSAIDAAWTPTAARVPTPESASEREKAYQEARKKMGLT